MFCPLKNEECSSRCAMFNTGSRLCNIRNSIDFYLSISDAIIGESSIPNIDNGVSTEPICFFPKASECQKEKCVFWDTYNNICSLTSVALNYQSYCLYLITRAQEEVNAQQVPVVPNPTTPEVNPVPDTTQTEPAVILPPEDKKDTPILPVDTQAITEIE